MWNFYEILLAMSAVNRSPFDNKIKHLEINTERIISTTSCVPQGSVLGYLLTGFSVDGDRSILIRNTSGLT